MIFKRFKQALAGICAAATVCTALPYSGFAAMADELEDLAAAKEMADTATQSQVPIRGAGEILAGDVNNDGTIDASDEEALSAAIDAGTASSTMQADVDGSGAVDATDLAMLQAYIAGETTYFPIGEIYDADASYITRGEWMHKLVEYFDMTVEDESTVEEFFTDVSGTTYEADINLAANFGVFDIDSETFVPDAYVSREFMAHTLNFCLGFPDSDAPVFTDEDDVYYAGDAQVAVSRGWFTLVSGEFHPDLYVVQSEIDAAFTDADAVLTEADISEGEEELTTADSVIEIEDTAETSLDGTTLTITGTAQTISEGDTISFPLCGNTLVRTVSSVSHDEETGVYTMDIAMPEDEEIVEDVVDSGYGYIDWSQAEALTDGVEFEVEEANVMEEETAESQSTLVTAGERRLYGASLSGTKKVPTSKLQLKSKTFNLGGGKLTISGGISDLQVPYNIQTKLATIQKLKVGVNATASLTAKFVTEMTANSGEINILSVPVYTCGVASINLTLAIEVSVKGEITLTYSCGANGSIEYTKANGWRESHSFYSKGFTMEASVEEKIGFKLALQIKAVGKTVGEVYFSFGEVGVAKATSRTSKWTCLDVTAHVYAEFGMQFYYPVKKKLSRSIFDASNSPFSYHAHFDNDVRVNSCTFGSSDGAYIGSKTADGGTVSKNGRVVYSGKAGNIKRAKGSSGSKWVGSYTPYTMTFEELTPATEINEDTVLTEDMTYPYGLIINANLDLNGHTVTVKGDVTQSYGPDVTFNKGTMTVSGNYYITGADALFADKVSYIYMSNKEDTLIVDGDFTLATSYARLSASAGTCEFKGDFICKGNYYASNLHKTIFSSTKDQTIADTTSDSSYFNVVEVKNSATRKLLVESRFNVNTSTVCDGDTLTLEREDNLSSDTPYIQLGACAVKTLNITGDCNLGNIDFTGEKMVTNGNMSIGNNNGTKAVDMNGCEWTHTGDLTIARSYDGYTKILVDGGTLTVSGDLNCNSYRGCGLYMTNKKDVVTVGGDFTVGSSCYSTDGLTYGVLSIGGDIHITGTLRASENHQTILTGKEDHDLYMEDTGSYLNYLKIENSGSRKFTVDQYFRSTTIDCGEEALNFITNDIPGKVGSISFGTLTCSDLNIEGDVNLYCGNYFKGKNININGSCSLNEHIYSNDLNSILEINDATMTVKGDMTENESYYDDEYVKVSGGKLIVEGDYTQNSGILHISGGSVSVAGDATFKGNLYMDKSDSLLTIAGDMDADYGSYNSGITAGKIELAGDYTDTDTNYPIKSSGDFQFVLTGKEDQTVKIDSYWTDNNVYHFSNLVVQNADSRKIILKNTLDVGELSCDGKAVNITSDGGVLNNAKLRCPVNVTGNLITAGNTIDLNGYALTVDGNLYQHSGTIQPNTGKLTVNDYYLVTDEDSAVYGTSSGILSMTNEADYVCVKGDFITNTTQNHSKYLTAGLLVLKGNFHQMKDGTTYAFPASGTHQVLLSGSDKQTVTFDSYSDSHFNKLAMSQAESQYTFNENPCWEELIGSDDIVTGTTPAVTTTAAETTTTASADETTTEAQSSDTTDSSATSDTDTQDITTTASADETTTEAQGSDTTDSSATSDTDTQDTTTTVQTAVSLEQEAVTIGNGDTYTIPVTQSDVSYLSLNPDVATVDDTGVVTAVSTGTAEIKIYTDENTYTILTVTVATGTTVTVVPGSDETTTTTATETTTTEDGGDTTTVTTTTDGGSTTTTPTEPVGNRGDANSDGVISAQDAYLVLLYYSMHQAGDSNYTLTGDTAKDETILPLVDIDKDGSITAQDAYYILLFYSYTQAGRVMSWEELLG